MTPNKQEVMTREQAIEIIKTLSALESWSFGLKERLPDYLHENLCRDIEVLTEIVLKVRNDS